MTINRRQFLISCSTGLLSAWGLAGDTSRYHTIQRRKAAQPLLASARNLIFVMLDGGPSHVDTFDLKPGPQTPDVLGVQDFGGGFLWPSGIMPKLAQRRDRFSVIRAMSAVEAVHSRAVYHLMTAHRHNAVLVPEIPHFASVMSFKLAEQRKPTDTLPAVMLIGQDPARNGFLPLDHQALQLDFDASVPYLEHYFPGRDERFDLFQEMVALQEGMVDERASLRHFQKRSLEMMNDPTLLNLLEAGENPPENLFLGQCQAAVRVLAADKGTRVFQLSIAGWDHHIDIYSPTGLPQLCANLDEGLAYLLDELEARPALGSESGSLLDQTLIVAMGEFGRTVGSLNTSLGRDHYPFVTPALIAGGGVKPGRLIGATSNDGSYIIDRGWSQNREIAITDLLATLYSALGIDWMERFEDTPSGRVFEIVDTTRNGSALTVDTLFN